MKILLAFAALLVAITAAAATRDNDSTCDIKVGDMGTHHLAAEFDAAVLGNDARRRHSK